MHTAMNVIHWFKNAGSWLASLWNSTPGDNAQHIGLWIVNHSSGFVVVAIVGVLLWLFGIRLGKKLVQWSIALFAIIAILSDAF